MELSWIYSIPAVVLTLALLVAWRRNRTLVHPAPVLVGLYWVSSVGALVLNTDTLPGFNFDHTWEMLAGYVLLVMLGLLPAYFIGRLPSPDLTGNPLFRLMLLAMIPLAWFSLLYQIPYAFASAKIGADVIRARLNTEDYAPLPQNLLTTVATATSQFYPLYALAAVDAFVRRRGVVPIVSCVAGALCVVVNSICFAARDGVLWFLMSFWLAYWMYRQELLTDRLAKLLRVAGVLAVAGALLVLSVFTYQRFATSNIGILDSVVTYFGQQPYVFAETVAEQTDFYGMNMRLPLIAEWRGTFEPIRRENVYEWTFGTFAKDFYAMNGWTTAFAASAAIAGLFTFVFRLGRRLNPFSLCLLLLLYFQFMTQGMFYFRLGTKAGNVYLLLIFLFALVLQLFYPKAPVVEARPRPSEAPAV